MSEPTDEIINRKIAEFMDDLYTTVQDMWGCPQKIKRIISYTESLNELVPVVEKLCFQPSFWYYANDDLWEIQDSLQDGFEGVVKDISPARALAMAVYKVLEEIE